MKELLNGIVRRTFFAPTTSTRAAGTIQASPLLMEIAACEASEAVAKLGSGEEGLSEEQSATVLAEHGPTLVEPAEQSGWLLICWRAWRNPLVIPLLVLGIVSWVIDTDGTGVRAAIVMLIMVLLGVVLRFIQEARADRAAAD